MRDGGGLEIVGQPFDGSAKLYLSLSTWEYVSDLIVLSDQIDAKAKGNLSTSPFPNFIFDRFTCPCPLLDFD